MTTGQVQSGITSTSIVAVNLVSLNCRAICPSHRQIGWRRDARLNNSTGFNMYVIGFNRVDHVGGVHVAFSGRFEG